MKTAYVKIWDNIAGAVSWDDNKQLAFFEYDPAFVRTGLELAPLTMPLARSHEIFSFPQLDHATFRGLPGLLADALPDDFGNQVINTWLARQGRALADFTPVDRLCYTGQRGMGALTFAPAMKIMDNQSEAIDMQALVDFAQQILLNKQSLQSNIDSTEVLEDMMRVGTSAGGARPKAVIALHPETHEVRSGQVKVPKNYEHWLLKFDGIGGSHDYGKIEYAYYQLASRAGIEMSECRLLEENGRAHFMSKRFDRTPQGEKLHLQSLCALAHYDYRQAGAYGYEQAFRVMRELRLSHTAMEQQYRRMVFNVIARNQDDHTKNISFLMDQQGTWHLSPAYDITYSYNPEGEWTQQHQMSINGKRMNIQRDDLLQVANNLNIRAADKIIDEITNQLACWQKVAADLDINHRHIQRIAKTHLLL